MAINIHGYKKYKCTGIDMFVNNLNFVPYLSYFFTNAVLKLSKVVSELVHVMLNCYPCSIQVLPSGLQVIPSCAQSCLKVVPSGAQVLSA